MYRLFSQWCDLAWKKKATYGASGVGNRASCTADGRPAAEARERWVSQRAGQLSTGCSCLVALKPLAGTVGFFPGCTTSQQHAQCTSQTDLLNHHQQHQQPLAVGGCRGATDVLMIFLQPSLSSTGLRVLARGSSVHSLMLSCQHFFGLLRLLPSGTVPCMMVFASPVARVTCPYHLSFLVLTMERWSSRDPMAALTRTC